MNLDILTIVLNANLNYSSLVWGQQGDCNEVKYYKITEETVSNFVENMFVYSDEHIFWVFVTTNARQIRSPWRLNIVNWLVKYWQIRAVLAKDIHWWRPELWPVICAYWMLYMIQPENIQIRPLSSRNISLKMVEVYVHRVLSLNLKNLSFCIDVHTVLYDITGHIPHMLQSVRLANSTLYFHCITSTSWAAWL